MAAVADGQRPCNRFRQGDTEKRAGSVGLHFPPARTEAVEVDRATRGSADVDRAQLTDLDAGNVESTAFQQAPHLARVAGRLQMAGGQERRHAPPAPGRAEDAGAPGEIGRLAEAFQREPPFLHAAGLGRVVLLPVLRCEPEARDAIESAADAVVHAAGDEHGHVIDPAVPVRVFRQPERVDVRRVLQRLPVGAAA